LVIGVDKTALAGSFGANVRFLQKDIFKLQPAEIFDFVEATSPGRNRGFDVVLSDAAPSTTGERFVDQQNSLSIATRVVEIALAVLRPGGHLVVKIFQGPDTKTFLEECRTHFESLQSEKPQGSRRESFEVYWVGLEFGGHIT
jgi:23S rRNA (uridine2552-2'-O)-methyltransferase